MMDDQHRALRLVADKERQIAREGRTLGIRLDNALRQARMLSEAPTSNLDLRELRAC
jgi:hypothetical protein